MAKRYLDDQGVSYKDIDVDEDPAAAAEMVSKTGQAGIPVLEIGDRTIIGFDKPKIDDALKEYRQEYARQDERKAFTGCYGEGSRRGRIGVGNA
jgi:glutaredoxin